MNKVSLSFPQIANYYVPINYLFTHITDVEVIMPSKITNKTIEIGSKHSPEFVCTPFKYTLGTMIESLEKGANYIIQLGGGCRYGYYASLQEVILKDLGYKFKMFNLINNKINLKRLYKIFKEIDKKFNPIKAIYYLFITIKMIKYMDKIDDYIRRNVGFEKEKNSFNKLNEEMLNEFKNTKGYFQLYFKYKKYYKKFKNIKIKKPKNCLKVGIIGELYTIMEPFSNYYLEKELASYNIEIKRFTNVSHLMFNPLKKLYLKMTNLKYKLGSDSSSNIYFTKYFISKKYDGIIHLKSSFCTPEILIMPIINKMCNSKIPVIFFTFDINTSEVGIKTRIEAFKDMIEMRKKI